MLANRSNTVFWLTFGALFVASCAPTAVPTPTPIHTLSPLPSRPDGWLALSLDQGRGSEIFIMKADGSERIQLTLNSEWDSNPSWSLDGQWIAFESYRDRDSEIFIIKSDGSGEQQLTDNSTRDELPSWSPDGEWIVFQSLRPGDDKDFNIFIMRPDGSEKVQLTDDPAPDWGASWSPDGESIAFGSLRGGGPGIFILKPDGSNETKLTEGCCFSWSPDGKRIAFVSDRDGDFEIFTVNVDGSEVTGLTSNSLLDCCPMWSPDGKWIIFNSRPVKNSFDFISVGLFIIGNEGSNPVELAHEGMERHSPGFYSSWSPEGEWIAYTYGEGRFVRESPTFIIRFDGTQQILIANNKVSIGSPSWAPAGWSP